MKRHLISAITLWTFLIAGFVYWDFKAEHENALAQAQVEARTIWDHNLSYRKWITAMGGLYVPRDKLQPNPYLDVADRDKKTVDGIDLTLVNPAYMTSQVFAIIKNESEIPIINRIVSEKYLNPANKPDEWESGALRNFAAGMKEVKEFVYIDGKPYMRLMKPMITMGGCLKCHGKQGYRPGDVRGGISVAVPLKPYFEIESQNNKQILLAYFLIWVTGLGAIVVFIRTLKRNRELTLRSEERLAFALDAANEVWWERDCKTGKTIYSPRFYQLLGYEPDKFTSIYEEWRKIIHPEDVSMAEAFINKHLVEEKTDYQNLEMRMLAKDGQWRWISSNGKIVERDTDGNAVRLIGTYLDITQRKLAEESLRVVSAYTRSLIEASLDPLVAIGPDGKITDVNAATESVSGHNRAELIGTDFSDYFTEPEKARAGYQLVLAQGILRDYPLTVRHATDRTTDVLYNASVYRNEAGEIQGVFAAARDITERKRTEESLLHLAAIVKFSDDAIVGKSLDGTILSWNRGAEQLYGYKEAEVKGRSVSILIPDDLVEEMSYILDQINQGLPIEHYETSRVRKDGKQIDVSVTISPICDSSGKIVGASTIARDITELRRAEIELRKLNEELEHRVIERTGDLNKRSGELSESQRALMNIVDDLNEKTGELEQANVRLKEIDRLKSLFIASMSHELRTPLNSIIGFSSVILNEWVGPVNAEQKENLAIILRSGKHLLNLINDVIDVSKIEAGKIESFPEEFDLKDLIGEAVSLVKKDLEEKGLDLRIDVSPQQMFTDRRRLLQSVLNLLSNAVKFTEHGRVTVETRITRGEGAALEADVSEIAVTDTGVGIREEDLPKMFQPFVRLVAPGQSMIPGTGLGLYLTRKLTDELLKGNLDLTSEYGKGSRFTLRIPVRLP